MLTKKMTGRLGNQMFQYASMRGIQSQLYPGEEINLDFNNLKRYGSRAEGFYNQLKYFNISNQNLVINKQVHYSPFQKLLIIKYFLERKIIKILSSRSSYEWKKRDYESIVQKFYNKYGLYFYSYGYYDFNKSKVKNKLFIGFYESPEFFNNIRDLLIKEFRPKEPPLERNSYLYERIEKTESVCVTIRRGDFVNSKFSRSANVCDKKYFAEGMKIIKKKVNNPQFFVFSDDIEWVKKNIEFPPGTLFEGGNDPVWEKLRLMYSCKHFIISNSSFSWWAQYLSRNKNKIVVAPCVWRREGYNGRDLYNKDWFLVDV